MQPTKAEAEHALRLIDQALAMIPTTRQQHQQFQLAIMTLNTLVEAMNDGSHKD